jgi:hypothetical protein
MVIDDLPIHKNHCRSKREEWKGNQNHQHITDCMPPALPLLSFIQYLWSGRLWLGVQVGTGD